MGKEKVVLVLDQRKEIILHCHACRKNYVIYSLFEDNSSPYRIDITHTPQKKMDYCPSCGAKQK